MLTGIRMPRAASMAARARDLRHTRAARLCPILSRTVPLPGVGPREPRRATSEVRPQAGGSRSEYATVQALIVRPRSGRHLRVALVRET